MLSNLNHCSNTGCTIISDNIIKIDANRNRSEASGLVPTVAGCATADKTPTRRIINKSLTHLQGPRPSSDGLAPLRPDRANETSPVQRWRYRCAKIITSTQSIIQSIVRSIRCQLTGWANWLVLHTHTHTHTHTLLHIDRGRSQRFLWGEVLEDGKSLAIIY